MPIINDILNETNLSDIDSNQELCNFLRSKFGEYDFPGYYYARHPDFTRSEADATLTLVTGKGLHGIEFQKYGRYKYNYTPLQKIQWIQSFNERNSYIVQISIDKTYLWMSDVNSNKSEIDKFINLIIHFIEAL